MRAVLLDMGGVLVELGGERPFLEMIGGDLSAEEMWRRWLASPSVRAHETGRLGHPRLRRGGGARVRPVRRAGGVPRALHGLARTAPSRAPTTCSTSSAARHRTAILTNISAVHWPIAECYGLFEKVERVVASYRIGAIKPDRDFFEIALAELGATAAEAVFFDDNVVNVEGARACGIEATSCAGRTRRARGWSSWTCCPAEVRLCPRPGAAEQLS